MEIINSTFLKSNSTFLDQILHILDQIIHFLDLTLLLKLKDLSSSIINSTFF